MSSNKSPVIDNPWAALRRFTDARIALGHAGVSLPTTAHLAFQLAHAQARDAVHRALDAPRVARALSASIEGKTAHCLQLHSAAAGRDIYLRRPDLGRTLDAASREVLTAPNMLEHRAQGRPYDLALVVADGLSALAIEQNAAPFLAVLLRRIGTERWRIAPVCVVQQGRVAIGDEIAELLGAKSVVVLIGERPGLSSPDSMGLYLTWMPRVGVTDSSRNCISNVRPAGLGLEDAAHRLHYLLSEMHKRQLSGVGLKDDTMQAPEGDSGRIDAPGGNFLLE